MSNKTDRLLLIVDPQIDFITGSLPVPNAAAAMDSLATFVNEHGEDYSLICITCDRHPLRHSSFKEFGGIWPSHCVESSVGAAVWPPLMEAILKLSSNTYLLYKGEDIGKDEYSIFQNPKGANEMKRLIESYRISDIDICGLAGDVCVANTLQDAMLLYPNIHFNLLSDFTAYLDNTKH